MTPTSLPLGAPLLSAAAGAVEVDVNPTLVLMQLGVVTVLMLVLKPFLFDPLLAVFERRERMVEGTQHEARKLDDEAADIKLEVDGQLSRVTAAATEERDRVRVQAATRDAEVLSKTRAEVTQILDQGRRELALQEAALDASLRAGQGELASDVVTRVLGREVAS